MANSNHKARVYPVKAIKLIMSMANIGASLIIPGNTVLLKSFEEHMDKKSARRTLTYLEYRKLVDVKMLPDGNIEYRLTSNGLRRYKKARLEDIKIKTPLNWDKKWRMVVYDIPTQRSNQGIRRELIDQLRQNRFRMLQKSIWIHPFECKEQVGIILDLLNLDKYASFFTVEDANFHDHAVEMFKEDGLLV